MTADLHRKEPRMPAMVQVRIFGMDAAGKPFSLIVHTLNISQSGALLANVDVQLNVGDVIGMQKGTSKAKFRVQWIGKPGSPAHGQVGVACTEPGKVIWELEELTHSQAQEAERAKNRNSVRAERQGERRGSTRHPCDIGAQIVAESSSVKLWARCTDISEAGCYLDLRSPMPVGARFVLTIFLAPDDQLVTPAIVRTSFAGMGMGIQFQFDAPEKALKLKQYIVHTFGPQQVTSGGGKDCYPELQKLAEVVEDVVAWAERTPLIESEISELEEVAAALRRQMVGLRSELDHKATERYIVENRNAG